MQISAYSHPKAAQLLRLLSLFLLPSSCPEKTSSLREGEQPEKGEAEALTLLLRDTFYVVGHRPRRPSCKHSMLCSLRLDSLWHCPAISGPLLFNSCLFRGCKLACQNLASWQSNVPGEDHMGTTKPNQLISRAICFFVSPEAPLCSIPQIRIWP